MICEILDTRSGRAAALLLLAGSLACKAAAVATTDAPPPEKRDVEPVRRSAPVAVRFAPRVVATGTLKPARSAKLSFAIGGTLARLAVERGRFVAQGAILATLDDAGARAGLAQAEGGVAAARAQLRLAADALERAAAIHAAEGLSQSQLVQAEAQRDLAAAQLRVAEAQLAQARVHLDRHVLRAPFAGVVTRVPDGIGFALGAAVPLFELEATDPLILETSLTQQEASSVKAGASATVTVPSTGEATDAVVRVVVGSVEPTTDRVPVELSVANPRGRVLPHAFARAELRQRVERDALRIPGAALGQQDNSPCVWITEGGGAPRALAVRVLALEGDAALIDPGPGGWPAGALALERPPPGSAVLADGGTAR
jgi:RND family efflux transporter MFP subunit